MGKHETLPFKMTVERGKLVPATPYDAERLDTWRSGTAVNVTFVRDGGRVMERKWWAILNRAVKECKTPWKTAAEASEAIKLAIGVVNLTKTVGGDFLAYPKSLTELDDPELDDAVQQMIDVIHHVTGVDPEEWKKQVAHIRDEAQTTTETGSGDRTADPDETGAEQTEAGNGSAASSAPVDPTKLSDEDRKWLVMAARMLIPSAAPNGDPDIVRNQYGALIKHQTPPSISQLAIGKAVSISKRLVAVCESTEELDLELLAGIAGCTVEEIRT